MVVSKLQAYYETIHGVLAIRSRDTSLYDGSVKMLPHREGCWAYHLYQDVFICCHGEVGSHIISNIIADTFQDTYSIKPTWELLQNIDIGQQART